MCYVIQGTAVVAWYDGDTHIYAIARASSELQDPLFTWWRKEAGPIHPRMTQPDDMSSGPVNG